MNIAEKMDAIDTELYEMAEQMNERGITSVNFNASAIREVELGLGHLKITVICRIETLPSKPEAQP